MKAQKIKFQTVTAFARRYNRNPERMTVVTAIFQVATTSDRRGDHRGRPTSRVCSAVSAPSPGVFELQTDSGVWSCPDGSK
jgi:hypothetical protein